MNKKILILNILLAMPFTSSFADENTISIVGSFDNVEDKDATSQKLRYVDVDNTTSNASSSETTNVHNSVNNISEDTVYSIKLNKGVDAALLDAFAQECEKISLKNTKVDLDSAVFAIENIEITNANNLLVSFNKDNVKKAISDLNSKYFTGLQNPVLVWVLNNNGQTLDLISNSFTTTFNTTLQKAASFKNYQIIYPIGDIDDLSLVNAETFKSNNINNFVKASQRYNCDYFVVATLDQNKANALLNFSVFNAEGQLLQKSNAKGSIDEIANISSLNIIKSISKDVTAVPNTDSESNATFNLVAHDTDSLGEGAGFVRVKIHNINNLSDFINIQKEFITFGFDGNINIDNYNQDGFIIDIKTKSDKAVVDGSLRHSKLFKKLGPWEYEYTQSLGYFSDENTKLIKKNSNTISGKINNYNKTN